MLFNFTHICPYVSSALPILDYPSSSDGVLIGSTNDASEIPTDGGVAAGRVTPSAQSVISMSAVSSVLSKGGTVRRIYIVIVVVNYLDYFC